MIPSACPNPQVPARAVTVGVHVSNTTSVPAAVTVKLFDRPSVVQVEITPAIGTKAKGILENDELTITVLSRPSDTVSISSQ
jgi:hypothetical protein